MGTATRKLIDIKTPVFQALSRKAQRRGVSLKRYIEDLLEADSLEDRSALDGVHDQKILSLIGMAKPTIDPESIEDDRLKYILSK